MESFKRALGVGNPLVADNVISSIPCSEAVLGRDEDARHLFNTLVRLLQGKNVLIVSLTSRFYELMLGNGGFESSYEQTINKLAGILDVNYYKGDYDTIRDLLEQCLTATPNPMKDKCPSTIHD